MFKKDNLSKHGLISVPAGRFVAAATLSHRKHPLPQANTMLVTKALSQDVMVLAFVPRLLIPKESHSRNEDQLIYMAYVLSIGIPIFVMSFKKNFADILFGQSI
ncbi:hypothetical protein B1B04_14535 [Lysinibacillus sp. KCTC 33748]|uniref:hypothetical protein n=1 Tax=unclassified Lysinibacillus TaxID=2636778 RepID=UPI0009A8553B|nr:MULTISPECIES: hypothetical protein [unclassified Lysinibacillus]OXS72837.1 hypothetical protein B1B04_14535 [Lysinibacillus sp. KCTC 33748]SKB89487.1 hypothetical protein SAMN06295926_11181 [Lysinibacillus sp. AC-3]